MNEIIQSIEKEQLRETVPQFNVGDTVKVYGKIKEGTRERIQIFEGTVISIKEFGAFIEFAPGKEGMVHISKISKDRVNHVEDVLTLGDKVTVICMGKDKMGRISFSMKDVPTV